MFLVGNGLGTYLGGLSFDIWHSYGPALLVFAAMLLLACILIAPLGPYPFASRESARAIGAGDDERDYDPYKLIMRLAAGHPIEQI